MPKKINLAQKYVTCIFWHISKCSFYLRDNYFISRASDRYYQERAGLIVSVFQTDITRSWSHCVGVPDRYNQELVSLCRCSRQILPGAGLIVSVLQTDIEELVSLCRFSRQIYRSWSHCVGVPDRYYQERAGLIVSVFQTDITRSWSHCVGAPDRYNQERAGLIVSVFQTDITRSWSHCVGVPDRYYQELVSLCRCSRQILPGAGLIVSVLQEGATNYMYFFNYQLI